MIPAPLDGTARSRASPSPRGRAAERGAVQGRRSPLPLEVRTVSLLTSALRAASRALGAAAPWREHVEAQRERAARAAAARPTRRTSRFAVAFAVLRAGLLVSTGRLDAGQRDALRARVRRAIRGGRRTRLRANRGEPDPRPTGGRSGARRRRTHVQRMREWDALTASGDDLTAPEDAAG